MTPYRPPDMMRFLLLVWTAMLLACGAGESKEVYVVPLDTEVVEYPTCWVLAFQLKQEEGRPPVPMAHDARITGLKVHLKTGETVDVMEQRFFWEEGGGQLLVRLGKLPLGTYELVLRGSFQAFNAQGRAISEKQELPSMINLVTMKKMLDYKLAVSLAATEDNGAMWLDVDANLERPLHVSGLPGARIDDLRIEGPNGLIETINPQAFMATASGGKIRVKVPALAVGSRLKLKGWWVPLRNDNTPCCGEQPLPAHVDVTAKDIAER